MSDCFALKTGSLRNAVEMLEPLLEVRFRKVQMEELGTTWMIALSKDKREHLVILPNESTSGASIDSGVEGYELLFCLVRSWREERITRLLTTETRFRFVRPANKIEQFVAGVLERSAPRQ